MKEKVYLLHRLFCFSCRDFCQHLYLQPGGHCHWKIQCHLQPSEIPFMADAVTRLPCHHRHLGAVTANHGALPGLQHPQVFPQGKQHSWSHVPPGLAQPTSWADLVSVCQRFHLHQSLNSSSSSSLFTFSVNKCAFVRGQGMTCLHRQRWKHVVCDIM